MFNLPVLASSVPIPSVIAMHVVKSNNFCVQQSIEYNHCNHQGMGKVGLLISTEVSILHAEGRDAVGMRGLGSRSWEGGKQEGRSDHCGQLSCAMCSIDTRMPRD